MVRSRRFLWMRGAVLSVFALLLWGVVSSLILGECLWRRNMRIESEVISSYLRSEITPRALSMQPPPLVVVSDHTRSAEHPFLAALLWPLSSSGKTSPRSRLPAMHFTTFASYRLVNMRSHALSGDLTVPLPYQMVDRKIVESYNTANSPWLKELARARGYFQFSSVGFSLDGNEALLQAEFMCGLCGSGGYVLMRKVDGQWKVAAESVSWIS